MLRSTTPRGIAWQGFGITARPDRWWVQPVVTGTAFAVFVLYALFSAFLWKPLFGVPYETQGYLSPFFSPLFGEGILPPLTPGILILWAPLGFRLTCYYCRRAYYRTYLADPPACAVAEPRPHARYALERRLPFILQNLHRFFLYAAIVPVIFLWLDTWFSLRYEGQWRIGLGNTLLFVETVLVTGYTLSCHSMRHLAGGRLDRFSAGATNRVRHLAWRFLTMLNVRHMEWFWVSLVSVVLADLYVRLLAAGAFVDPNIRL